MATVGAGRYIYEMMEGWGKLPQGLSLGVVTGEAVDSQERVYIYQPVVSIW